MKCYEDEDLPRFRSRLSAFRNSGFDKGHMVREAAVRLYPGTYNLAVCVLNTLDASLVEEHCEHVPPQSHIIASSIAKSVMLQSAHHALSMACAGPCRKPQGQ